MVMGQYRLKNLSFSCSRFDMNKLQITLKLIHADSWIHVSELNYTIDYMTDW